MIDQPCEAWCVLRTWPERHPGHCMRTLAGPPAIPTRVCEPWCNLLGPHERCVTRTAETNPKGNTCGSSAEHKRAPGCAPPPDVIHAFSHTLPDGRLVSKCGEEHHVTAYNMDIGNMRPATCKRCVAPCSKCGRSGTKSDPHTCGLPGLLGLVGGQVRHIAPSTPAAMLGEALEHVKRACAVLTKHGHVGLMFNASILAEQIDAAKREAEAREATGRGLAMLGRLAKGLGTQREGDVCHMPLPVTVEETRTQGFTFAAPETCWATFIGAPTHNLGELPEKCYTCAAKRREATATPVATCVLCTRPIAEHDMTNGIVRCPVSRDPSPGVG